MWFRIPSGIALVAAMAIACSPAAAQTPPQNPSAESVADAAKRAREQKKGAGTSAKVITDDDLDSKNVKPGEAGLTVATPQIETQPPSPEAVAAAEAADKSAEKSPADDPLKSTDSAKIAQQKKTVALAEEDLNLSQRESALQQDSVYSKPDYQRDTAGKAKIAELQQQTSEKQDKVKRLKAELAAMEEGAARHNTEAPASAEPPAAPPQP